jgi:linoleoyl-CoA desaturase
VGHDASHQALLDRKAANTILSYAWNLIGISKQLWEIKHHYSHHIYTNIPHQDVDIAESQLLRFSPAYPYRSYYKYQHLYAPLLYSLFGMHIVYVRDFTMYFSIRNTTFATNRLPRYFLIQLLVTKLFYLLVTFIIPLLVLSFAWWQVLLLYIISQAIAGVSGATY